MIPNCNTANLNLKKKLVHFCSTHRAAISQAFPSRLKSSKSVVIFCLRARSASIISCIIGCVFSLIVAFHISVSITWSFDHGSFLPRMRSWSRPPMEPGMTSRVAMRRTGRCHMWMLTAVKAMPTTTYVGATKKDRPCGSAETHQKLNKPMPEVTVAHPYTFQR